MVALGSHSTPTTVITDESGKDEIVIGFNRQKILELAGVKKA